jgi:hypothetical protein
MNHEPASIKKRDKKESKRRKEEEGKRQLVRMMVVGKEERDRTIRNKQRAKTKYVIFTHDCCELLFAAQHSVT